MRWCITRSQRRIIHCTAASLYVAKTLITYGLQYSSWRLRFLKLVKFSGPNVQEGKFREESSVPCTVSWSVGGFLGDNKMDVPQDLTVSCRSAEGNYPVPVGYVLCRYIHDNVRASRPLSPDGFTCFFDTCLRLLYRLVQNKSNLLVVGQEGAIVVSPL